MGEREMLYAVQTNIKVVERRILMTTAPGDLVLDPTYVRQGTRVWFCAPLNPSVPDVGEGWGGALTSIENIGFNCTGEKVRGTL